MNLKKLMDGLLRSSKKLSEENAKKKSRDLSKAWNDLLIMLILLHFSNRQDWFTSAKQAISTVP